MFQSTCRACGGSGSSNKNLCSSCEGQGSIPQKTNVKVAIPKGIDEGERIMLQGAGGKLKGGQTIDLYIEVTILAHNVFRREKQNLFCNMYIPLEKALLGGIHKIKLIEGTFKEIKIPEGSQNGDNIVVSDAGIPFLKKTGRGNLTVTLFIEIPKNLSSQQKKMIEELGLTNSNYNKSKS
jgi:molecular chaperone DnaJ